MSIVCTYISYQRKQLYEMIDYIKPAIRTCFGGSLVHYLNRVVYAVALIYGISYLIQGVPGDFYYFTSHVRRVRTFPAILKLIFRAIVSIHVDTYEQEVSGIFNPHLPCRRRSSFYDLEWLSLH